MYIFIEQLGITNQIPMDLVAQPTNDTERGLSEFTDSGKPKKESIPNGDGSHRAGHITTVNSSTFTQSSHEVISNPTERI